ncbi:hypothetical protein [Halostagnicola kamekurae]|uniref:Uncharacterized protein n=1 Tax=Halostagnicola kamekurae TaxID=619731 RepID=A0A1I6UYY8_9EURY|nr:hypothetical protein [Halostagnicola kamekurae]SFT06649.1 hypothetical protein SAMN04488556_4188 [Halostagnicola kamekurae]
MDESLLCLVRFCPTSNEELATAEEDDDDVQKITTETTLENHYVTYSFEKPQDLGLIQVENPAEWSNASSTARNGCPKHPNGGITKKAEQYLKQTEQESPDNYGNLSHTRRESPRLENQVQELEQKFEVFRNQIQQRL